MRRNRNIDNEESNESMENTENNKKPQLGSFPVKAQSIQGTHRLYQLQITNLLTIRCLIIIFEVIIGNVGDRMS